MEARRLQRQLIVGVEDLHMEEVEVEVEVEEGGQEKMV